MPRPRAPPAQTSSSTRVDTADRAPENRTTLFEEALAIMREVKRSYTVEDVAARATEVVHALVGHRVTLVRTDVDVDSIVGLGRWTASSPRASTAGASPASR